MEYSHPSQNEDFYMEVLSQYNTSSLETEVERSSVTHNLCMCNADIEHLLYVFFDFQFVVQCWNHIGLAYDMQEIEDATIWLLDKLSTAREEELRKTCTTLWGFGFGEIKKSGRIRAPHLQ